jgi:hypothetical protein
VRYEIKAIALLTIAFGLVGFERQFATLSE